MRLIGLDPGLQRTGWGVVEAEGSRLRWIASGTLKSDAAAGRVYLPLQDLARFRYSERELFNGIVSDCFRDMMKFQIARAQRLLDEGATAIGWIAGDGSRLAAATIVESCRGTIEKLEAVGGNAFEHPPKFLSTRSAIQRLAGAWRLARRGPQVEPLTAEAG